jgi:Alpha 1,4-glycosyltransferase conserved region/Glycosyltransferase sugar-binding region containing DXD motif
MYPETTRRELKESAAVYASIMNNRVVQSLWIGKRLSSMSRLAIQSFLANGHEFHLYCYDDLEAAPSGTTLKDARDVLPADRVFAYSAGFGQGSFSAFSNFFRYKLLLDRGGWWVDTDVVCLRPFDFAGDQVLASEDADPDEGGGVVTSSSVLKQPADSAIMKWAWEICQKRDPASLRWGEVGPRLLHSGVSLHNCQRFVQPPIVFSPVPFYQWRALTDSGQAIALTKDTYAVHLWHQMWRAHGVDPDGEFHHACLYSELKRRFIEDASAVR